jgi:hypothetical protein
MYFDGSYTLKGAGDSVVLIPPEGDILKYAIQLGFPATNNIAEYEGWSLDFDWLKIWAFDDSLFEEILSG